MTSAEKLHRNVNSEITRSGNFDRQATIIYTKAVQFVHRSVKSAQESAYSLGESSRIVLNFAKAMNHLCTLQSQSCKLQSLFF